MIFQEMPADQATRLRAAAITAPWSDPAVEYPDWYMHRWHFLPEGYLSRRSAAGYDRAIRNVYYAMSEHRVFRDVLRRVRALAPQSVLEVGIGPGRLLGRLARLRSIERLTGVELSPYLLERAADRIDQSRVELIHASGLALPVAEGSYDAATACHYLGHLPAEQRRAATDEIARAVRPGGHVIVVDHRWHPWPGSALLRRVEDSLTAFGTIRLSTFERLEAGP